ncbi:uroporphyrin-3 C-methyltransferase [Fluviicoccus keumensis]|uniref:Uroporphyrin-3 C-methyltransferase n=1 Tax=Fluviicoccus keumensis TaxID=1435465 RepID=A0A4Q7ZCD4_9GAMM|nr:uroporphyrinogen-III C-methyltransferase [Fluviicoccus keumensis]RZU47801.1 uroporphyrin-3 C-methyltransferase [Fluviicoccus keumensis]
MTDIRRSLGYAAPVKTRFRQAFIRVLLLAAVIAAGFMAWQLRQQDLAAQQQRQQALEHQLAQLQQSRDLLSGELAAVRRQQGDLAARLDAMTKTLSPEQRRQWLTDEVAYYLDMAEQHLQLQQDVTPALRLVELADSLLSRQADPGLALLREGLAADRLSLLAAQQVDRAGLSVRLDALKQQAARMALPMHVGSPQASRVDPARVAASSVWEKGWQSFRQLITIRRYDAPVRPLLGDDQRWLLQQSVYLELTQAQLALWRNQNARYHQSLEDVRVLLKDYTALSPGIAVVQQELSALSAETLPDIPLALTQSRHALSALRELHPAIAIPAEGTRS